MKISKLILNKKNRKLVNKNELKFIFLKFFISWLSFFNQLYLILLPNLYKLLFKTQINKAYFSSIKNICLISGRTRSIISIYKISRIYFNHYMDFGKIPG